ncbi:cation transporter [Synergistales bacterium]|nr:cation transporter [Synergistales bacterium]
MTRYWGLAAGVLTCFSVWHAPLAGLAPDGRKCLALTLMAIIWWTFKALPAGYVSLSLLLSYTLLLNPEKVGARLVFELWTTPVIYLVIGGFLIAEAVRSSGLGKRIALEALNRYIRTYKGVIISCYVLNFALSLMIPHPWPRSFLLMSAVAHIANSAKLSRQGMTNIGLAVFVSSIPTSMILLTGDSSLNIITVGFAGADISWLRWLLYMGMPGVFACVLTCCAQLWLFGVEEGFALDKDYTTRQLSEIGKISRKETICIIILGATILAWTTDSLHHVHPGWIALLAVVALSSPFANLLDGKSFSSVNLETLFFLSAATAIGAAGRATGMNSWVIEWIRPETVPVNHYAFALYACFICMLAHLFLGSILAVLSVTAPAIIALGNLAGLPPIASALIAYTAVALHWILPFHSMNILVGYGPDAGGYTEKDTLKASLPQTLVTVAVCLFEITWWKFIGLL